jgi:hypothetical protein
MEWAGYWLLGMNAQWFWKKKRGRGIIIFGWVEGR